MLNGLRDAGFTGSIISRDTKILALLEMVMLKVGSSTSQCRWLERESYSKLLKIRFWWFLKVAVGCMVTGFQKNLFSKNNFHRKFTKID